MRYIFLILLMAGSSAFAKCDDTESQRLMAKEIYQEPDFRNFACRGAECSEEEFLKELNFYAHVIDKNGNHEACAIDTNINTKDQYVAVYLTDTLPVLQFVHIGGVEFTKKYYNGRVIIYAEEHVDHSVLSRQMLVWSGSTYLPRGNLTERRSSAP